MSENPDYKGTTHTDDVLEAIRRGVFGEHVRRLGAWQERLTYLQTRFMEELPTRTEAQEIQAIAHGLGLTTSAEAARLPPNRLITQCLNEIHYLLTGHRRMTQPPQTLIFE